jgi:hypothetical protein
MKRAKGGERQRCRQDLLTLSYRDCACITLLIANMAIINNGTHFPFYVSRVQLILTVILTDRCINAQHSLRVSLSSERNIHSHHDNFASR